MKEAGATLFNGRVKSLFFPLLAAATLASPVAAPAVVEPQPFSGAKLVDGKLSVELPAKSVVVLELR